jgi:hypothetical protein
VKSSSDAAGAVVIVLLVTTCAWLNLDRASPMLIALAAAALAAAPFLPVPDAPSAETAPPSLGRDGLVPSLPIAALIFAPITILLVGTLREEFPFSGDHNHHLYMGRVSERFWIHHLAVVTVFAGATWGLRRTGFRYWAIAAFAVLFVWSFFGEAPESAPRYPASAYVLDVPLQFLARKLVWSSPLDAHRITTALCVPAWLYVLRPLALRRWPDAKILPFALFFFWQQDVVYYDTTAYLEPWSIVFVLTAIELLASDRPTRSWLPVLLCGVAAGFKEQAVLVLPWVGLASLATIPRTRRAWGACALNGALALLPFLCWYQAVRPLSHFVREWGLASIDQILDSDRARVFGWRVLEQFGWSGVAVLAASLAVMIALTIRTRSRRWLTLCLLGAALTQVAFFYVDRVSIPWTGNTRFHLFALALFGFAAWMPDPRTSRPAIAALIALAQLPTLAGTVALAFRPDPARNYFEHYDAPIYFPIKSLVLEAHAAGVLPLYTRVAIHPIKDEVNVPMRRVYPTLRYDWVGGITECRCGPGHEALLVRLAYPARLRAKDQDLPISDEDSRCLADVDATYARVFRREIGGRPTGVLGVGCRPQPPP